MSWKSKLKVISNQCLTYDRTQIQKKLEPFACVSFDIFDTLVKRSVAEPRDVFAAACRRYNEKQAKRLDAEQFRIARIAAEHQAREKAKQDGAEEVTLSQIYDCLPEGYRQFADDLMAQEIETEKSCCHADPTMKKVFQWCSEHGKRIFITSDMYLPKAVVEEILTQCGYQGYTLYLSSEVGVTKSSGGLFRCLLELENVAQRTLIHVGDNLRGDWLGARKQGIAALWIANDPQRTKFTRLGNLPRELRQKMKPIAAMMNGWIDPDWDCYYQFGFEVLGPLLYGFSTWLHENVKQRGLTRIFFLSRDGYLMQKGYQLLYGADAVENSYLYVSRKALFVPQLWIESEFESVIWSLAENTVWNCDKLCDKLGIDLNMGRTIWTDCGLLPQQSFLSQELGQDSRAVQFYQRIQETVIENSKSAYADFVCYLQQQDFAGKIAIVDIGWRGSMQYYLQSMITHADICADIHGFYVGRIRETIPSINLSAYIPPEAQPRVGGAGLFESLFLAQEGSTKAYRRDPDGYVRPVLYQSEYTANGEDKKIQAYQEGALAFIEMMKTGVGAQPMDNAVATANLYQAIRRPRKLELGLFADLSFSDGDTHPLAAPQSLGIYLRHPKRLMLDFATSQWKIGFLKRLFRIPISYWDILFFLKKVKGI